MYFEKKMSKCSVLPTNDTETFALCSIKKPQPANGLETLWWQNQQVLAVESH